jgi:endonuclease/exonuclease/phosphatase family metal-dependent hydrolase
MPGKFRRFGKRLLIVTNVLAVLFFLLACLTPYVHPGKWWFIAVLGLGFPFLLALVTAFIFFWLIVKPRLAFIPAAALLIGWKSISVLFAFHTPGSFKLAKKDSAVIRVVSWNVARFIELKKNNNAGSQTRLKMLDILQQQNADILCLQEFHTSTYAEFYDNITAVKELGYPYMCFSYDNDGWQHYYSSAIFSRLPIIDTAVIHFNRPSMPEALIYADIKAGNDTLRVYTTHLQSLQLKKADYEKINGIKNADDGMLSNSKTIFSKLRRGYAGRQGQTDMFRQLLNDCPYPKLVCGDFNDIPNSYTYFTIRGDMQDAFLKKGFGIGRTYAALSPTLRIDYMLADKTFDILQFNRLVKNYSDHYMLVTDVKLREDK